MNIQDWFPLGLTDLTSLQSKGLSRVLFNTVVQKRQFFGAQLSLWSSSHMITGKAIAFKRWVFVVKVLSLFFKMLSRLVITFLPRSKFLFLGFFNFMAAGIIYRILESNKIKSLSVSIVSPSICHEMMGLDAMILVFWMLNFKPTFSSPLSLSSRGSLVLLHFLTQGWCHLHIWDN